MNYYEKYIKYKNKYLHLKDNYFLQNSGANGNEGFFNARPTSLFIRKPNIPSRSSSPSPSPSDSSSSSPITPQAPKPPNVTTNKSDNLPNIYKYDLWDCDKCKQKENIGNYCAQCSKPVGNETRYNKTLKPTGIQLLWTCNCGKQNECDKPCWNCRNPYRGQDCIKRDYHCL